MTAFRSFDRGPAPSEVPPAWRLSALTKTLRTAARQITSGASTVTTRRRLSRLARLSPPTFSVRRVDGALGGLPCRWFHPKQRRGDTVLLHLHGGGFCIGSSRDTHDLMLSDLARLTGLRTVGVDYRLAPECRFPGPIDDCVRAFLALVDEGIEPSRIVVTGDSAGGNLALALAQRLRDARQPLPRALALMSPWVDLELRGETVDRHQARDYLSRDVLERFVADYMQGASRLDPLASPCHADFSDFPPMLVQVGGFEAMLSEVRYLACRAKSHGAEVELQEWPQMIHAFHGFGIVLPEAHSALRAIGHFIDELEARQAAQPARALAARGAKAFGA